MNGLTDVEALTLDPDLRNIYGKSGGDDFFILNELHKARGFRKLHIEKAVFGSSLEILHAVFFPQPAFDLPIFGVDIVANPLGISAAIVDLSPVRKNLPSQIEIELMKADIPDFEKVRKLPDWGDIFSSYVQFITPMNTLENDYFLKLVDQFMDILLSYRDSIKPDPNDSSISYERLERQIYYCQQQKLNDKTRNVLTNIFGSDWTEKYIEMVLFDSPEAIL